MFGRFLREFLSDPTVTIVLTGVLLVATGFSAILAIGVPVLLIPGLVIAAIFGAAALVVLAAGIASHFDNNHRMTEVANRISRGQLETIPFNYLYENFCSRSLVTALDLKKDSDTEKHLELMHNNGCRIVMLNTEGTILNRHVIEKADEEYRAQFPRAARIERYYFVIYSADYYYPLEHSTDDTSFSIYNSLIANPPPEEEGLGIRYDRLQGTWTWIKHNVSVHLSEYSAFNLFAHRSSNRDQSATNDNVEMELLVTLDHTP